MTAITTTILQAIADSRGVDVADLDFVLHTAVDTSALNALGQHDGSEWQLTLSVGGHTVSVDSDRFVLVDGESP